MTLIRDVLQRDPSAWSIPNLGVSKVGQPRTDEEWAVLRYELDAFPFITLDWAGTNFPAYACTASVRRDVYRVLQLDLNTGIIGYQSTRGINDVQTCTIRCRGCSLPPFADQCARYGASGYSFYVAPGTSTWNTLAGRWDNAVGNLRAAAEHGVHLREEPRGVRDLVHHPESQNKISLFIKNGRRKNGL